MKNLRIFGLLSLLLLLGTALDAQNDVVRLKDGSFIRGTIIEYIAGDHVKIKTEEGKVYEFPADQMLKTESGSNGGATKTFAIKTKGYYNITSIGVMFGNNYGLNVNPGLYTVNGWQWNAHLMTGIGAGIEYMENGGKIPLTADVRWNFLKGMVTPWAGVSAGYTVATKQTQPMYIDWWGGGKLPQRSYGGITTGASFGFRAYVGPHLGITGNAGYRFQKLKTKGSEVFWNGTDYTEYPVTTKSYLNRFTLGFGLLFN